MRHKIKGSSRLILRSELGQVRLNEAIGKAMNFEKLSSNEKKGTGTIKFRGFDCVILLKVKLDVLEHFHTMLEGAKA